MNTNLTDNSTDYYALLDTRAPYSRGTKKYVELTQQLKKNKLERKIIKRLSVLRLDPFDEQQWTHNVRTYNQMRDLYEHLRRLTKSRYQEYQGLRAIHPDIQIALHNVSETMRDIQ